MFKSLKNILKKTTDAIKDSVPFSKLTKEDLENILLEINVDYDLINYIIETIPHNFRREDLQKILSSIFEKIEKKEKNSASPFIDFIIGVNGAGKTTTIAKLTKLYLLNNKTVMLGAGDTFRAAAIEQLKSWADILNVPIVYSKRGKDSAATVYDTISSAKAKKIDNVIIDTAGRLHNNHNLSEELKKMVRISNKAIEGSPHRKILIIDGTQGHSAINQAKLFNEIVNIDGIIITKLDGSSKGGSIFSIVKELKIPILYIGTGEKVDDIIPFNYKDYITNILDEVFI